MTRRTIAFIVWSLAIAAVAAEAQTAAPPQSPATAPRSSTASRGIRGVVEAGASWLTAAESFTTVTGTARTTHLGGGLQATNVWRRVFVQVDVSRARATGQRVFVHQGTHFPLGIPVTITMMPIEATGGYRIPVARGRLFIHAGGGIGVLAYREESPFGIEGERVDERFRSWHLLGGMEVPIVRWFAAGAEVHVRSVPNALGAAGVSAIFRENDLGGTTLRLRVTVGR